MKQLEAIKLSICLPTKDQPHSIERLLTTLEHSDVNDFEVIVHDGSVGEETSGVISKFLQKSRLPLSCIRRERSIDDAIIEMVELAVGKYIWVIGDDDIIPNGLQMVMDVIQLEPSPDYIFVNYQIFPKGDCHIYVENRYFKDKNEVLSLISQGLGFCSANIYLGSIAKEVVYYAKLNHLGTGFVNFFFPLHVISTSNIHYLIGEPVIRCFPHTVENIKERVSDKNGNIVNNAFEIFGLNFYKVAKSCESEFDSKIFKKFVKKNFRSSWKGVLVGSAGGWDTTAGKKKMLIKNFYFLPEAWLALLLFSAPEKLNAYCYRLFRKIFRGD